MVDNKKKKVLLAPLDPVHDIGLKMIKRGLEEAGHNVILLPPDLSSEEVINEVVKTNADTVLISRTLGYGVEELLSRFIDLADAAGIREKVKLGIGGMAITPELAAELGFDAGFGPGTEVEEAVAFVEDREYIPLKERNKKQKKDMTSGYDYRFKNTAIKEKLEKIAEIILDWAVGKTSYGIKRAYLRERMLETANEIEKKELQKEYMAYCDDVVKAYYAEGRIHSKTRRLTKQELLSLENFVAKTEKNQDLTVVQHIEKNPLVFVQYGTGCPFMDIAHIKTCESWGADGVVHFDPSWGARTEGFYEGYLSHEEDGSVITPENLDIIKKSINPNILWQVRAHRGLNTPETVVLAGKAGADLTKINIVYGSLGGGTDPARLTIDAIEAIKFAAKYNLPFDVVTNEELSGVPSFKAFAGMLIVAYLSLKLGAKPILQPLFCYSPEVMIGGQMKDNYVDFNAAKIIALRNIVNAPIWPGAPIGFLTHTEDRVQSAMTTALHAGLASSLGVDAISIASSDEAFSGGPITAASRIDTLRATKEVFRFLGHSKISPTEKAEDMAEELIFNIERVLNEVIKTGDFVKALYDGVLGNREEGAYPGRAGKGTVISIK
ncbi:MAG: hypothetical protein PWP21_159 [Thermosediminibacterales bacterium]|nr:hypothetical protein [Thermosediminibacterales bacterium]